MDSSRFGNYSSHGNSRNLVSTWTVVDMVTIAAMETLVIMASIGTLVTLLTIATRGTLVIMASTGHW
jgi:hypothetical protein